MITRTIFYMPLTRKALMKLSFTKNFLRSYKKLPPQIINKFKKQFKYFCKQFKYSCESPKHPSLHVKKIKSAEGIWEGNVDKSYMFTFEISGDCYYFRNIDNHDECLKNP